MARQRRAHVAELAWRAGKLDPGLEPEASAAA
ncbi:hypothetical protein PF005_g25778 [Phytophthora fragariae]|uniref:Uncharacterized protein n=2 Tax=Phytophthora TaxID=4783 RepID=A0A6A4CBF2_9STRA|nr:hypothetical protein PR002_g22458 [Phytophthora rubi]KAE9174628.1 hypothetical protein PF005_g25778 [Phytophthora fragariae]KAE9284161.1 hypothetical protein PF001_g22520 [Phytophthora fragariae]KAE9298537.1 hypothetical protein PR003_g23213 [Phytophthora rubi]